MARCDTHKVKVSLYERLLEPLCAARVAALRVGRRPLPRRLRLEWRHLGGGDAAFGRRLPVALLLLEVIEERRPVFTATVRLRRVDPWCTERKLYPVCIDKITSVCPSVRLSAARGSQASRPHVRPSARLPGVRQACT